jgi:hypothetical protein
MGPVLITIVVVLVCVFAVAFWMDHKRKRLGDTKSGGAIGEGRTQLRRDAKGKGEQWSAGG